MFRRILLAEDHEQTHVALKEMLESDSDIHVDTVGDGPSALETLSAHKYSIFLTDLAMPGLGGMELVEEIQKRNVPVALIVMTSHGSIDQAVQAMRLGAYDFLTKPVDLRRLRLVVQRVLRERRLVDEVTALRDQLQNQYSFGNIISKNPRMHAVFELISNVAQTNTTVLIEGETGTGKEQVALAIHHASLVRTGPMIAVNCAALPETLLESELFGHEKGAFTSAVNKRTGRFELAHGGTIFLDEVGDIPPAMQAKLLRVLQERRFERVGGTESIEVDVRVIGASNRSLQKLVQEGKFREDLYYRLNVVKLELPPLRERREDIPLLAAYFAQKYARQGESRMQIPPKTMDVLLNYSWPGNIRELENLARRLAALYPQETITTAVIDNELAPPASAPAGSEDARPEENLSAAVERYLNKYFGGFGDGLPPPGLYHRILREIEYPLLSAALAATRGNQIRAADLLGVNRNTLRKKIRDLEIQVIRTSG